MIQQSVVNTIFLLLVGPKDNQYISNCMYCSTIHVVTLMNLGTNSRHKTMVRTFNTVVL